MFENVKGTVKVNILYVGFKGKHNASNKLVSHYQGDQLFLTNSFTGLQKDINNVTNSYDLVYAFGIDQRLKSSVRIENCAEKEGDLIYSNVDIQKIKDHLKHNGIYCECSDKTTHYFCNDAYYYLLNKYDHNVVFIHIPPLKYLTDHMMYYLLNLDVV